MKIVVNSKNKLRVNITEEDLTVQENLFLCQESNNMENFPSKSDNLTQIKTKKWQQFIFGTLESDIEFDQFFLQFLERVGWMPIQDFIFDPTASRDYLVKANWALYCDNYLEGFHIPFIHKDLAKTLDYSKYKSEIYPLLQFTNWDS